MEVNCTLSPAPFDPVHLLTAFTSQAEGFGAVASFTGIARPVSKSGSTVHSLFLDHHPRLTLASMEAIAKAAQQRFATGAIHVVHRCGQVQPNEAIVLVAAASKHRRAALDTVDFMMDHLKAEAVFWKREETDAGHHWIEPTDQDYAALARWQTGGSQQQQWR